jgi:voltage-gated potassium channel
VTQDGRPRFVGFVFTVLLLGLIALAIAEIGTVVLPVMFAIVSVAVGSFYLLFPGSNFFAISLTNFLGVYACMFVYFTQTNFQLVETWAVQLGFPLPVLAFIAGAALKRDSIRHIVYARDVRGRRQFGRTFRWLMPIFAIGALTFFVPAQVSDPGMTNMLFLAAMGGIAVIVLFASPDIATFLLDSGLLFEEFFQESARLLLPAFAFFTFYSLVVIVFGCIYRILDRFTDAPQFTVGGAPQEISFADALYFSIITVSTVGYGDVVPLGETIRVIVAVQILVGVVLLLFGFSEIVAYSRERMRRDR